jgi:hypothetical protein
LARAWISSLVDSFPSKGTVVDLDGTSGNTLVTKEESDLPSRFYELSFEVGGPDGGMPQVKITASLGDIFNESIAIDEQCGQWEPWEGNAPGPPGPPSRRNCPICRRWFRPTQATPCQNN